uniref:Uncharacterized protein n=1 Tax=Anguilla anguilla TaxID=7936 RepID=A0A0E9XI61_ANGAN
MQLYKNKLQALFLSRYIYKNDINYCKKPLLSPIYS